MDLLTAEAGVILRSSARPACSSADLKDEPRPGLWGTGVPGSQREDGLLGAVRGPLPPASPEQLGREECVSASGPSSPPQGWSFCSGPGCLTQRGPEASRLQWVLGPPEAGEGEGTPATALLRAGLQVMRRGGPGARGWGEAVGEGDSEREA